MVMTSVSGHLTAAKFDDEFERNWSYPPPDTLFEAPVRVKVEEVCDNASLRELNELSRCKL